MIFPSNSPQRLDISLILFLKATLYWPINSCCFHAAIAIHATLMDVTLFFSLKISKENHVLFSFLSIFFSLKENNN